MSNNTVINECKLLFVSNWFIFDIRTFVCRIKTFKKKEIFFIVKCSTIFVSLNGIPYFIHLEICIFHGHPCKKPVSYAKSYMMIYHDILNGKHCLSHNNTNLWFICFVNEEYKWSTMWICIHGCSRYTNLAFHVHFQHFYLDFSFLLITKDCISGVIFSIAGGRRDMHMSTLVFSINYIVNKLFYIYSYSWVNWSIDNKVQLLELFRSCSLVTNS